MTEALVFHQSVKHLSIAGGLAFNEPSNIDMNFKPKDGNSAL
jgi:hypothetical protein